MDVGEEEPPGATFHFDQLLQSVSYVDKSILTIVVMKYASVRIIAVLS